jgi:hypothetical protein
MNDIASSSVLSAASAAVADPAINLDITTESVEETALLHLKDANGALMYADAARTMPRQIELYGPGSTPYCVNEARQNARQTKRFNDNEMKLTSQDFEEQLRETAVDLAAVTKRFVNFTYPPAGNAQGAELFAACYSDIKLGFIVKQVQKALRDWSAFRKGSETS